MTETMQTEMVPVREEPASQVTLFGTTEPVALIEKAGAIATALARVIDKQGLYVNISGRNHVRVEGWTFLGSILGVFPVVVRSDELTRDGQNHGFEAHVEARTRSGEVVGSAVARCTRDESTWAKRPDFALLSMASTRATSKAMRLPLGWVMTLAGYDATPAEEMAFDEPTSKKAAPARSFPPTHHDEAPRQREPGDDDVPLGNGDPASMSKGERVRRAIDEMFRLDPKRAAKDRRDAASKAGISGKTPRELTDEDYARMGPFLPDPFTVL